MTDAKNKTILYFAYGSNMLTRRLAARTPSARPQGIGYVERYRLAFHKLSRDGSGKADIEATDNPTDRVYGVLFRIDPGEEGKLDRAEGHDKGLSERLSERRDTRWRLASQNIHRDGKRTRVSNGFGP